MLMDMITFSLMCLTLAGVIVLAVTVLQNAMAARKARLGMNRRKRSAVKIFETTLDKTNVDRKN